VITSILMQLAAGFTTMPCTDLQELAIPGGTITSVSAVAAGPFTPPTRGGPPGGGPPDAPSRAPEQLPAHCRVTMVLTPTADSNINVELWLPTERWNGKFLAVGNGGWAGSLTGYADMAAGLRRGYATAGTDTGHSPADGPGGMFALGHPEKIVDFAYRAVHDMTIKSKRIIDVFYAAPLDYSYFKGCSTGGRQAVMAAQRYPGDFDGIIAGALANRHVHMHTVGAYRSMRIARHPEEAISEEKAALVNAAVMAACDSYGEGFLNNPRECSFDFATLLCDGGAEGGACLTEPELRTVETFYGGLRTGNGELLFSGQAMGNPLPALASSPEGPGSFAFDTIRILGFQDANYDWRNFDLDRDMPIIDAAAGWVDAVNPDLRGFEGHGGKLLLYAGWRDTGITPENTVLYYESVRAEMGSAQDDWLRLFLAPGMGHCRGGPGVNTFDTLTALEQWREQGVAPAQMLATNPESGLSRPLCPYPQYAKYAGGGDLKDARNWSCAAP
jgi:feruloyl esterase